MVIRVVDAMTPELAIALAVVGSLLVWRLTGFAGFGVSVGVAGVTVAAWRAGARRAEIRAAEALDTVRRQLATTEETVRSGQGLQAAGRLTVGIAHDFNNQLTVIGSNVEMLQRCLNSSGGRAPRHAEAALQGVQRAAALTSSLLALSRAQPPEPEAVDVNRLIDGVASLLRRSLGNRVGLDVRPVDDLCFVWADLGRLETAVLSLAIDASERMPDGDILTVAASAVRLDVPTSGVLPGEYVAIDVAAPDGAGPVDGTAFGMALGLARAAGGTVTSAASASFRLLLPRYVPQPAPPLPRAAGERRETILVVEDDADVRASCVEILRGLDYEVLDAPDALEGFRIIADRGGIDLLLADIGLPGGVNGRALADAARQVDGRMRVVFTTGYPPGHWPVRPGTPLLPKPFGRAQLAGMVRQALDAGPPAPR
jgi:CheY-like chemotaxis protein